MLNIVLFGPPGAGKGTQADKLQERYGLLHFSTGEAIREHMKLGTELGRLAAQQMEGGKLASDTLVLSIIEEYVATHQEANGVIYDGFPRTLPQAEAFDKILKRNNNAVTVMLALEVGDDEVIRRITMRGKTSGRADDQNIGTIRNRIDVYNRQTAVVAEYYKAQDKYRAIKGEGTIDDIFDRLCQAIDLIR